MKKIRIWLIILIILVIGLIIVFFLWNNLLNSTELTTVASLYETPTINVEPTKQTDDWIFVDNTCFTYKYPSTWKSRDDTSSRNIPETGIQWVKIFSDQNTNIDIAKFTLTTNGTEFNYTNYKRKYFPITYPRTVNGKKLYNSDHLYLTETNCKDYYLIINILDPKVKESIENIAIYLQ
jgi:signal peptidase I